jgi:hypothetical protein
LPDLKEPLVHKGPQGLRDRLDRRAQLDRRETSVLKVQLAHKERKVQQAPKAQRDLRDLQVPRGQLGHRGMRELRDPLVHREFKVPQDLRVVLGHREQRALLAEQLFHIII